MAPDWAAARRSGMRGRLASAWLRAGSSRVARRSTAPELWSNRRRLVAELAPGKRFLDIGGMFDIAGDVALWAEHAGAAEVLIFDGMDPSPEFARKMVDRPESRVRFRQGDLHDPQDIAALGTWDVVWCAGVIYHSPNPYQQLLHCRRMTRETLLLGTHVIPEVPGVEQACVWYPGRSAASEAVFAAWYGDKAACYPGASRPFDHTPLLGYANMFWGLTQSAVEGMLRFAGFEIVETYRYTPDFLDVLARVGDPPDFIPPTDFSRERGRERRAEIPEPPAWWVDGGP